MGEILSIENEKLQLIFAIFTILFLTNIVSAQNTTSIYFFCRDDYQHCARVEP